MGEGISTISAFILFGLAVIIALMICLLNSVDIVINLLRDLVDRGEQK